MFGNVPGALLCATCSLCLSPRGLPHLHIRALRGLSLSFINFIRFFQGDNTKEQDPHSWRAGKTACPVFELRIPLAFLTGTQRPSTQGRSATRKPASLALQGRLHPGSLLVSRYWPLWQSLSSGGSCLIGDDDGNDEDDG